MLLKQIVDTHTSQVIRDWGSATELPTFYQYAFLNRCMPWLILLVLA